MSTPTRFSDGQYKNWLKCSQSLIIMKEALHDYIDKEVKDLHGNITLKVSSISCGSSTGNLCGLCSSKGIKLKGGKPGNWIINCKNRICDKWLHEILAVHDDPHNPNINWKNADISLWPTDRYQVAKIFMPKGQDKTTKMPDDLDAPAILSLLKYCRWFRKDIPNTQILSDLIEIRNKVLHSGVLRVTDGDKDIWIDLMIQLLQDLNIHGDTHAELDKLKKDDIDINFRENEIKALQKMVSSLVSDIDTVKEEMATLQNAMSDLSEDAGKVRDSTTETTGKMNAVEANMEGIRKTLEELRVIYDKMVSFFDKNPGILEKEIAESIRTLGKEVKDLQSNLSRVEMELKARVSSLEKKVEGVDGRLAAVEEQMKHETETARMKRPETDGLRQLKKQTEDRLDTQKKLECIPTKQAEEAKKLLEEKRSVVIKGNPGEGKTTMALHLIDNEMFRDKRVVLNHPRQWEKVETYYVAIVVLEDVFGQYDFDHGRLQEWMLYLPTIQEHVDAGKLQVIVTTRVNILSKAYSRLRSLKLFSDDLSLTLSSQQLTDLEKMSILNRELLRNKRNMKEDDKKECIANIHGLIGFPQCCSLFAGDGKLFDKGPHFFSSAKKFFVTNITELDATSFLSLAFLFCNGKLWEENLSPETMSESSKQLLMELACSLHISEKEVSIIRSLRFAYDNFLELYVVKSMLYDFDLRPLVEKPCIRFTHATVSEAVGHILEDHYLEIIVKYGDSEYLYQRTYTAAAKDITSENVFIPVHMYSLLAQRMVDDVVKRELVRSVVKHSALKNRDFLMKLKCELSKSNVTKDFFMAGNIIMHDSGQYLSSGKCVTFMQFILQSDIDVVRLVYGELLELLSCAHKRKRSYCWKCGEKQKLLELALYYHHVQIADKLIAMKASYTHVSLCNAAKHGEIQRVQTILETLKKKNLFNPEAKEAQDALCRAYISGKQSMIESLLKEGITLNKSHVLEAVRKGDINLLMKVVEYLRHCKSNNSQSEYFYYEALHEAYIDNKYDMADYLVKNLVKLKPSVLVHVLQRCNSQQNAFRVIQDLKDAGTWDPYCDDASGALRMAYICQMYDVCNLMVQNGVSLKMKNLCYVTMGSFESVRKAIQHLKDSDNWDPKCDDASKALEYAICYHKYDVYDLLVQDGVSLKMKNFPHIISWIRPSSKSVEKAIQHLKDNDKWDPNCDDASKVLEYAIREQKYDVYDLLIQNGVSLKMKNLSSMISIKDISLESVKKAIQHLKYTDNWDLRCDDASEALENAIYNDRNDIYDLLVHDGVSLPIIELCSIKLLHKLGKLFFY